MLVLIKSPLLVYVNDYFFLSYKYKTMLLIISGLNWFYKDQKRKKMFVCRIKIYSSICFMLQVL